MNDELIDELNKMPEIKELLNIYQTWLSIFPFNLDCFKNTKEIVPRELPILKNDGKAKLDEETNEFTLELRTNEELYNYLVDLTLNITENFNHSVLYTSGELTEPIEKERDLINTEHRLKTIERRLKSKSINLPFIGYIKEWLEDEQNYIKKIVATYDTISEPNLVNETTTNSESIKKVFAKHYALLCKVEMQIGIRQEFELTVHNELPKREIEEYGKNRFKLKSGNAFYKAFSEINFKRKEEIAIYMGKNYKQKVIELSDNSAKVIKHLRNFPD